MSDEQRSPEAERIRPLGAPDDLTHPVGPVARPAAGPPVFSDDQLKGIGRFLAFGWYASIVLRFMLLTGSSSETWVWVSWSVPAVYLLAVHLYAFKTRQRRILRGFWPWALLGVVVLVLAPIVGFFVEMGGA